MGSTPTRFFVQLTQASKVIKEVTARLCRKPPGYLPKHATKEQQTRIMNKSKIIILSAIAVVLQLMGAPSTRAQELFKALLQVTCISTNQNGGLVYTNFGNRELIAQCAADEGITNVTALSLVFNPTADALQVVTPTNNTEVGMNHVIIGTNQFLICTPLTFTDIVSLSDTNTNKIELLASVLVETNSVASGTLAATERFRYSTNELTSFSLIGRIQYAVGANGTNSPSIYRGVLLAGSGLTTNQDEDEHDEGEGNHGNNGNHGNGNNANNGNHGNGNNNHHGK
jgi:hypothetical protein